MAWGERVCLCVWSPTENEISRRKAALATPNQACIVSPAAARAFTEEGLGTF